MNKAFLLFGILALAGTSAFAEQVNLTFVDSGNNIDSGYYLSPYPGMVTVPGVFTGTVDLFCDDINHSVSNGDSWTVNVSAVTGNLSQTLYGTTNPNTSGPTGNKLYEEEAYLASQILSDYSISNLSAIQPIQDAMWVLTAAPGANVPNASSAAVQTWLTNAQNYVASSNSSAFSQWFVLTDTNTSDPHQEFLADASTLRQTPEPATMALGGCGLLAVYFAGSRRRRKVSA